jgi:uncharacterized protein YdeI (YjbR/CyaY-like superfamily)
MNTLRVVKRGAWRAWLKANGGKEKEIWLIFYKKHTGKARLAYEDAVEEALCFGWIDSIIKRLDDETCARKFTPRNPGSKWSDLNIERARKMIAAGSMTAAGLSLIDPAMLRRRPVKPRAVPDGKGSIPAFILEALAADAKAGAFFAGLAPSYRRLYVHWVGDAKKAETRGKRLVEMLATLRAGRKLGLK